MPNCASTGTAKDSARNESFSGPASTLGWVLVDFMRHGKVDTSMNIDASRWGRMSSAFVQSGSRLTSSSRNYSRPSRARLLIGWLAVLDSAYPALLRPIVVDPNLGPVR